jgi:hypothetical protein
MNSVT